MTARCQPLFLHPARVAAAALAALLFAAPPAAAQISEKQAVAQAKSALKGQLGVLKGSGKAALATLNATLKLLEQTLSPATDATTFTSQVAVATITCVTGINEAYEQASGLFDASTVLALQAVADGGDLEGLYPLDFYAGAGGLRDTGHAQLLKVVAGLQAQALKRLAKTIKLAEKESALGLTVRLRLPVDPAESASNPTGGLSAGLAGRIDLLLAGSSLELQDDGLIVVAGFAGSTFDPVECWALGGVSISDSVAADPSTGRFLLVLDNSSSGLPEGNYVVVTEQGDSPFISTMAIGVR